MTFDMHEIHLFIILQKVERFRLDKDNIELDVCINRGLFVLYLTVIFGGLRKLR